MNHNMRIYNILGNYLDRKALNMYYILVGSIQKFPIWKKSILILSAKVYTKKGPQLWNSLTHTWHAQTSNCQGCLISKP